MASDASHLYVRMQAALCKMDIVSSNVQGISSSDVPTSGQRAQCTQDSRSEDVGKFSLCICNTVFAHYVRALALAHCHPTHHQQVNNPKCIQMHTDAHARNQSFGKVPALVCTPDHTSRGAMSGD